MDVNLTLKDVIDILIDTYKGIDLRSAVVKLDGNWTNALTVVGFSCKDIPDIKHTHKMLANKLGDIKESDIAVVYDAIPITQCQELIDKLKSGSINVSGYDINLIEKISEEQFQRGEIIHPRSRRINGMALDEVERNYPHLYFSRGTAKEIDRTRNMMDRMSAVKYGYTDFYEVARGWLKELAS